MITNDKYTVNLRPGCGYSGEPVRLSQYDTGRVITFDIFNGTEPFTIGSYTAKLEGTRSDGMAFPAISGTKVSGSANTVQFVIDGTVSKSAGRGRCEIVIYNGSERVGSGNVLLIVEKAGMKSDALIDNVATSEQAQTVAEQLASLSSRVDSLQNNGVDSADIQNAVNDYLQKNPVSGGSSVSVSNLLTTGEIIATLTVNGVQKQIRAGLTNKVRIDFDGANFRKDGSVLNYKQLYDAHLTSPDFAFIVYGDRAYLLSYVQDGNGQKEMRFNSVIAVTASGGLQYSKTSGIYVQSTNGTSISNVSVADITNENTAYKTSVLDQSHRNNNWYPSASAVMDYAEAKFGAAQISALNNLFLATIYSDPDVYNNQYRSFCEAFGITWRPQGSTERLSITYSGTTAAISGLNNVNIVYNGTTAEIGA